MRFQETTITPQMASEMLSHNMRNRRLSDSRVKSYAKDILNGKWTDTPTPIAFSAEGVLIDGQHRLSAVVVANTPVKMMVAYDVPTDAVIDRGLPRDSGSALYIRGLISKDTSTRECMAIVNRYLTIQSGTEIQDYERADFINAHQDHLIAAMEISRAGSRRNSLCKKAPVQTAITAALIGGVSEETLTEFANIVNTGFMSDESQSSAVLLRNYLLEASASGHTAQNTVAACAQMAIRDDVNKNPHKNQYRRKYHVYINGREACAPQIQ